MSDAPIPWSKLRCCDGHHAATHVPKSIAKFFSRFAALVPSYRKRAYWELENHIITQGTLFEPAPYALALILSEVTAKFPKVPDDTFDLLYELSAGDAKARISAGPLNGQDVKRATQEALQPFRPWLKKKLAMAPHESLRSLIQDTIENMDAE